MATAWSDGSEHDGMSALVNEREPNPDALERERLGRIPRWNGYLLKSPYGNSSDSANRAEGRVGIFDTRELRAE